jgi:hypothetical protein
MFGALTKSLASWREAHGFGILCILSPLGEHFVVVPSHDPLLALQDVPRLSEAELRTHLAETGLSEADIDDAVQLSRDWATTFTGTKEGGSVLWPLPNN